MPDSADEYGTSGSSGSESDRPNRWQGPSSTWRDMNQDEINTFTALNEIRNQDLSVHLYNAFALKRRHQHSNGNTEPVPDKDINAATGQLVTQDDWLPQRLWTAWPMSEENVPPDDFMRRGQNDVDERYTIRKSLSVYPSVAVKDAIGAAVLKYAKDKFKSRPWEDIQADPQYLEEEEEEEDEDNEDLELSEPDTALGTETITTKSLRSRSRSRLRSANRENEIPHGQREHRNMHSEDDESATESDSIKPLHERVLQPMVSTDDQMSYDLMRPVVHSILTKLDTTLMVLHHSRDATVNYLSNSSSDSEPDDVIPGRRLHSRGSEPPTKKRRGRPAKAGLTLRLRTPPPPQPPGHDENTSHDLTHEAGKAGTDTAPPKKRKAGRPRKIYPRVQGETDQEWAIRVARLRKEPVPIFKEEVKSEAISSSASSDSEDQSSRTDAVKRRPGAINSRERATRRRRIATRFQLRNWKDVLGAAALAGFPQEVLDRAAKRCADLFGGDIELHTLAENPSGQGDSSHRMQYHTGMIPDLTAEAYDEEYDSEDDTQSQAARHIRASSAISASSDPRGRSRSRSRSISRASTRSRSRSVSVANSHFCSIRGCERAAEGFSRRSNLVRHMKLVHNLEGNGVPTEVDSEDEMHGAVHVDGFLRPIKVRKGWRGDDVRKSAQGTKRSYGGRYSNRKGVYGSGTDTGGEDAVDVVMGED